MATEYECKLDQRSRDMINQVYDLASACIEQDDSKVFTFYKINKEKERACRVEILRLNIRFLLRKTLNMTNREDYRRAFNSVGNLRDQLCD